MLVTVAICTWNRARLLDQALTEMRQLRIPEGVEWELLIVNNNCTDATDEVIATHSATLPIRRLFESTPGQSSARNRVVAEAGGEYIFWTDDDALVSEDWLSSYCRAIHQRPDASIFGGPVEPWFDGPPPAWLQQGWDLVSSAYAVCDLGPEPMALTKSRLPYGINYVSRTVEQRRFLYDPELGLRPGSTLRGEETTAIRAMLASGLEGWWVPDARVRHFIPRQRQTTKFLRGFFRGQGEFDGRFHPRAGEPRLFGLPRWMWRQALSKETRYRLHRVLSGPEIWLLYLRESSMAWGQMKGYQLGGQPPSSDPLDADPISAPAYRGTIPENRK